MDSNPAKPAGRPLTGPETQRLERFYGEIGAGLAAILKSHLEALETRLRALEAETTSLRRGLTTVASGAGQRRRITGVEADGEHPGCSRVLIDSGDYLVLPDERLGELATVSPVGRA
jgi:hypothetical protein